MKNVLKNYRDYLHEASFYYSELYHCAQEDTVEAQHFEILTGLKLDQEWSEKDLKLAVQEINHDFQRCLDFYAEYSSVFLRYNTILLSSGSIGLTYIIGQLVGCSATLWNRETFARKIANSCLLQEGTEGRILLKMAQNLATKKCFLSLVEKTDPQTILNTTLEKRGLQASAFLRAMIDAGGMFKRYSNWEVAEEILKFKPLEDKIDGVIFLNKKGQETFSLLKRGATKSIPLLTTSQKEIESYGVPIDRLFVYFDELRATGSDVPFKADGTAVMTFNPFSTTMRTGLQANLRARKFFYAQVVDTVIQTEALEGFFNYDERLPESCLNAKNFFYTAIRNQTDIKKIQLLRSALEQIREIHSSRILLRLIRSFAEAHEEIDVENLELSNSAEWLFYSTFKDDPISLFFDLQRSMPAFEIVEKYLEQIRKGFQETCANYFEHGIIESIEEECNEIVQWARKTLTWNVSSSDMSMHVERQMVMEKQNENQLELNVEMQKEIQRELQKYGVQVNAPAAKMIPWEKLKDIPTSFEDYQKPGIITFNQLLKRVPYEWPYDQIFPQDLYLSENLARSQDVDLPVFHKAQKNIYHILLIRSKQKANDQIVYHTLYIDLKEAVYWREQIRQYQLDDCWLCDLDGHLLNEDRVVPEEAADTLKRVQWWGHFFNGNAGYLRAFPLLVQQELKNENYELKYRFLHLKAANHPLQTKILTIDPILTEKPVEASVFQFNNKLEEQKWLADEIEVLDEEQLNQLPFHFARHFTKEQIHLLKRQGYFTYLPLEKFGDILPSQISLIPDHRLQYLCLPEQIAQVPSEKIHWLKGKALEYLPEKYLELINPEGISRLTPAMQKKYQRLQIKHLGLEAFAKTIQPCMASVVLPECVEFISDGCIPFLQTKEQLANVPSDKYDLLRARQFHSVPAENWPLFTMEDFKKYSLEKKIPEDAEAFIQQMNEEWVNEVDPRLAKYFSETQVKHIRQPKPIFYLHAHQLQALDSSMTAYLDSDQIEDLDFQHGHLIKNIDDPKIIVKLSNEALQALTMDQVKLIDDRDILLRLNAKFYPKLSKKQITLLQTEHSKDREVIKHLTIEQVKGLEKKQILSILPFLSETTLSSVDGDLMSEVVKLSCSVREKLTPKQMQCFLVGQKNRKVNVSKILKEMTAYQWKGMDRVFVESFFAKQPKGVVHCVPKFQVQFLSKTALLKWYDADTRENKIRDMLTGISSCLFYPFVLLSALMLGLFAHQKRLSWHKAFRKMAFSPLRFFARENYYRYISESIM